MNKIIGVISDSGVKNIVCDPRSFFIMRRVRLLEICLEWKDCITIGFVTNVSEKYSIRGNIFRSFSFGVLDDELV